MTTPTSTPTNSSPTASPPSSPLTSVASRSPSPLDYPSPPSSDGSEKDASKKMRKSPDSGRDSSPPAKKRQRITKERVLKTERLDIKALYDSNDSAHHTQMDPQVRRLIDALRTKRKIVVIAGAGISVSAGIPDFRSSTGLFKTMRCQDKLKASGKDLFDAGVYRNNDSTSAFHDMVRELSHSTKKAKPTPFHHMLASLAEEGRLMRLYTQNVDGIDTALKPLATTIPLNKKGPWPQTIQLHGGLEKMVCSKCGEISNFEGKLFDGPEAPLCSECSELDGVRLASGLRSHGIGRLRPRMVLYNEYNPDQDAIGAVSAWDLKKGPDAVIVVGTRLTIPGTKRLTKELCSVTRAKRGGFTAWINLEAEPPAGPEFKDCWDMIVKAECDTVAELVGLPKWDDKDCGDYVVGVPCPPDYHPQVVIKSKIASVQTQSTMTPIDSPKEQSPEPSDDLPKKKQVPLSFAPKPAGNLDAKKKKKRGRLQGSRKAWPTKPEPAANRINNKFSATKTSIPRAKKAKDALYLGLKQPTQLETDEQGQTPPSKSSQVAVKISYDNNRVETISPKGRLPSGMAKLLC